MIAQHEQAANESGPKAAAFQGVVHITMRFIILCLTMLASHASTWTRGMLRAAEPINIGTRRELFVDEYLIERMSGKARLQLHRPRETEDVFVHDTPWEGNRTLYYTLFRDGDIYRMYYRGSQIDVNDDGYSIPYNVTCYAESKDGIHWKRPNLGLVEFRGSRKNNIILTGETCHAFVPFKDANPACLDKHRYKAIVPVYKPVRGLHVYSSPDAIHWSPMSKKPVITTGYFDSQNLAFWDTERRRYVGFHRALRGGPGSLKPPSHEAATKDVMTATSTDFLHWTEPQWLKYSSERWTKFSTTKTRFSPYVQFYTNQIQQYGRASAYLPRLPDTLSGWTWKTHRIEQATFQERRVLWRGLHRRRFHDKSRRQTLQVLGRSLHSARATA